MSIDKFMIENAEVISALSFIPQMATKTSIHPDFVDKRWITLNSEVEKKSKRSMARILL